MFFAGWDLPKITKFHDFRPAFFSDDFSYNPLSKSSNQLLRSPRALMRFLYHVASSFVHIFPSDLYFYEVFDVG